MAQELTHTNSAGEVNMVDVTNKAFSKRVAVAKGFIRLAKDTLLLVRENKIKKGSVFTCAQLAGITAAKKCSDIIPLCHPILLTKIDVELWFEDDGIGVKSIVSCTGQTGVEMEALIAVSTSLLCIYDMCKAVDKTMVIENIELVEKTKEICNQSK